jgi:hypothetical protein
VTGGTTLRSVTESSGVMFHHFHGGPHPSSAGSIDAATLDALLDHVSRDRRILPAAEYLARSEAGTLDPTDTCLTFDDALRAQFDVALPVLEARGLTGFFFVYSQAFEPGGAALEVYRHFRSSRYDDTETFLRDFESACADVDPSAIERTDREFDPLTYLSDYSFYSHADRRFRFLRDEALAEDTYHSVMLRFIEDAGFDFESIRATVTMDRDSLRQLVDQGNLIGLHSHSHPTRIDALSRRDAAGEYLANKRFIEETTGVSPVSVSHPCGLYNPAILDELHAMGVVIGFRDSMAPMVERSRLEYPREDHSNIVREMTAA